MKQYTIKKINGAPEWANIPVADMDIAYHEGNVGIEGHAQLCWDETAVYVHLWAKEENIRSELTGLLEEVCQDSCLEFFFRPTETLHYFNIEFNPNCALWLGHGNGQYIPLRLCPQNQREIFNPRVNRTEDGWEIFYSIPLTFIQHFFPEFTLKEGVACYGNFYKCGDNTKYPHWFSWNDVTSDPLSFHRPQDFGRLIFGGE